MAQTKVRGRRLVVVAVVTALLGGGAAALAVTATAHGTDAAGPGCATLQAQVSDHVRRQDQAGEQRVAIQGSVDAAAHADELEALARTTSEELLYADALVLSMPGCFSDQDVADARQSAAHLVGVLSK